MYGKHSMMRSVLFILMIVSCSHKTWQTLIVKLDASHLQLSFVKQHNTRHIPEVNISVCWWNEGDICILLIDHHFHFAAGYVMVMFNA